MLKFTSPSTNLNKLQQIGATKKSTNQQNIKLQQQQQQHDLHQRKKQTSKKSQSPHKHRGAPTSQSKQMSQQQQQQQVLSASASQHKKQLTSGRVKTIIGKLLDSHGAELRRTLFSLRQIFQDDADLALQFVHTNGLECLLKVAIDADQIHQNYILRAIGQLTAHASALNCVASHSYLRVQLLAWLYSLLSSQHKFVARTAVKLLLSLVKTSNNSGDIKSNVVLSDEFCRLATKGDDGVGSSTGANNLSNLIHLFFKTLDNCSNSSSTDVDLLIDSMTLVNKTLEYTHTQDIETFNSLIRELKQQGMESIIDKYSNLDAQLREQFKLYEQKLARDSEMEQMATNEFGQDNNEQELQQNISSNRISKQQPREITQQVIHNTNRNNSSGSNGQKMNVLAQPALPSDNAAARKLLQQHHATTNNSCGRPQQKSNGDKVTTTSESNHSKPSTSSSSDAESDEQQATNDDNDYESANDVNDDDELDDEAMKTTFNVCSTTDDGTSSARTCSSAMGSHKTGAGSSSRVNNNTTSRSKIVQTLNENHQHQQSNNNRRHQLQLRSQPKPQHQRTTTTSTDNSHAVNNGILARGKQQRASISSCSSSDSYASYGSGYASGSGNSTDHEHKQQQQQLRAMTTPTNNDVVRPIIDAATSNDDVASDNVVVVNKETLTTNLNQLTANIKNLSIHSRDAMQRVCVSEHDEFAEAENTTAQKGSNTVCGGNNITIRHHQARRRQHEEEEEEDENDLKLKQHLSELEQLTDELASRDIYPLKSKQQQNNHTQQQHSSSSLETTSKHFSSNEPSSKASSLLSTGSSTSNISSLSSSLSSTSKSCLATKVYQFKETPTLHTAPSLSNNDEDTSTNESRSTTATPTLCATQQQQQQQQPARQQMSSNNNLDNSKDVTNKLVVSPVKLASNQHTMPSSTSKSSISAASSSSTSGNNLLSRSQHRAAPTATAAATTTTTTTSTPNSSTPTKQQQQQQQPQELYHHNLFQWEQLVSKGVTRPLLINDLDFTDLRDEDDCDLLNANNSSQQVTRIAPPPTGRNQSTGEPLSISIPPPVQPVVTATTATASNNLAGDHESVDSGASTGSPSTRSVNEQQMSGPTPMSAPPPLPPPPISPWFNTISGSRPQSQFMSSPSPPPLPSFNDHQSFMRDQSPAASSTYSNYSRNSICIQPQQQQQQPLSSTNIGQQHFNTLQPGGLRSASSMSSLLFGNNGRFGNNKRKKTMKLFWKEVREDGSLLAKLTRKKTIWDEIKPVAVDTGKLEYLFESKAKDLSLSKSRNGLDGPNQRKVKITVLDAKRSNAINIGMTKLPPMRTIKTAILKMDSSIMNREGIEKILTTMMPTEEEKSRIIEAQLANPDTPLGTAEQFLLNLASISALEARLKLWAFQLDYAQIEKEVAEPLMDLKQAIEEIEQSETFRNILGTLLAIGNFLNSSNAKGFQIDYLEKVPEVKDTIHKHSLLHHLCLFIQEKFDPDLSSDLYSEFCAVNRASKVDYAEVAKNLKKMQQDCKSSWDHLKIVAKHDSLANLMNTCGVNSTSSTSSPSQSNTHDTHSTPTQTTPKSAGKLNNLSKLSMITTVIGSENSSPNASSDSCSQQGGGGSATSKQLKMKVSDFLTDCAERIMVLMVVHRRVMNRFQKLLVYLGCPSHQIKQTQPQQILKIINEFALEYRTKRERVREMLMRKQQCQHQHNNQTTRWRMNRARWAGSQQCIDSLGSYNNRPISTSSSRASSSSFTNNCPECLMNGNGGGGGSHLKPNSVDSQLANGIASHRPGSPSGLSQISNFSDFLMDQSCCSRQESITPVPSVNNRGAANGRTRPHSMSVSMFDLQQQRGQRCRNGVANNSSLDETSTTSTNNSEELDSVRQKDEQLRRLLGAGKSFDGACNELYQMSHWTSTMARVKRRSAIRANVQ